MKFLVIGRDIGYTTSVPPGELAGVLEHVYVPSFEMLEKWEKDGKATGGFMAGQRGGFVVVEAASGEELSKLMTSLPFWGRLNWEVIPLQSYRSGVEDVKRTIGELKKMAAMPRPSAP